MTTKPGLTCGTCFYFERNGVNQGACFGLPPHPLLVGVQQVVGGQQPLIQAHNPVVPSNFRACSLHKPMLDLSDIDMSRFAPQDNGEKEQ